MRLKLKCAKCNGNLKTRHLDWAGEGEEFYFYIYPCDKCEAELYKKAYDLGVIDTDNEQEREREECNSKT